MTRKIWIALALFLAPVPASAGSAEIEHRCTVTYPSISQYFAWKDCVKIATQQEAEENVKRQSEEAARPCLATDIPRMEGLAAKAKAAVNSERTLEEAQAALSPIIGYQGSIEIPKDSIKDRVLIYSIQTVCSSPFRFLINVREGQDKKLRWFRTGAIDPPVGYPANIHPEFGVDFEAQREQERFRAEAAKRDADFKAIMAKKEQEGEEQRQKFLRSIKISDVKMKCMSVNFCSMRILEFVVTNATQSPVSEISFGWMLPTSPSTACPANLATKDTMRAVLQPGEKAPHSIYISNVPEGSDMRYCLSVTGARAPYPWEK